MYQVEIPLSALNPRAMPAICPISGATEGLEHRDVEFSWYPRWVNLLLLVGILFAVIAAAVTTKRAKGKMPFGPKVWFRWKLCQAAFVFSIFCCVVGLIFGTVAVNSRAELIGWPLLAVSVAAPVLVWWRLLRRRGVSVRRITDTTLILSIPNEAAALALRAKFGGAASVKALPRAQELEPFLTRTQLAPDGALCAVHPGTQAPWSCGRCGSFFCPICSQYPIAGRNPICSKCAGLV